jgi:hypothetical protein
VPANSTPKVNWQPISAFPLIGSMIDGLLDEVEKKNANLQAGRAKPDVFDNYTIDRDIKVYSDQAEDLWLYEGALPVESSESDALSASGSRSAGGADPHDP